MLKKIWFQTHWLLGISAGIVLAVVGVTGATLSFQNQILRVLNPGVMTVEERGERALTPVELLNAIRGAAPDKTVVSLTLSSDPGDAARVGFAGANGPRGETRYVDPYSGALLGDGALRGEATLRLMDQIHRRLAAGEVGKQITGACAIALVVLALSGLYLRWPRSAGDWRKWLTLDWSRKGRSFLWDLHAVAGTWALVFYLCAALTGLYWSYDWYRSALYKIAGVEQPQRGGPGGPGGGAGRMPNRGAEAGRPEGRGAQPEAQPDMRDGARTQAGMREGMRAQSDLREGMGAQPGMREGMRGQPGMREGTESQPGMRGMRAQSDAREGMDSQAGERGMRAQPDAREGVDAQAGMRAMRAQSDTREGMEPQSGMREGLRGNRERSAAAGGRGEPTAPAALDLETVWVAFQGATEGYSTVTLRLPERAGAPVQVTYLDPAPAHERAFNRLNIDPASGAVSNHQRYADKNAGEKFMASIYPLHTGSFFGVTGSLLMMIASLAMPLFAITGWMLYLQRRRKQRAARSAARASRSLRATPAGGDEVLIGYASQSGFAAQLAWQTAGNLQSAGVAVAVHGLGSIEPSLLGRYKRALFLVSTFGEGEAPDSARSFARKLGAEVALRDLKFGLLALGDRQYQTFCGFGRQLERWLRSQGAAPLFDPIEVDRDDADALRDWQHRLNELTGVDAQPAWQTQPDWQRWRLAQRRLLNPGSAGNPTFHVELEPVDGGAAQWQSGDLVELLAHHSSARVEQFLAALALDGTACVRRADGDTTLAQALALSLLPDPATAPANIDPQRLVDSLHALAPRQYSIASLPGDGRVHLLVRQARHPARENGDDGELGLASGWLTEHAAVGDEIALRLRSHTGFHLIEGAHPLLLIGNGTGLAGLRAHLKARVQNGHRRNWLIFGERNAQHDFYYREEIESWRDSGDIERLDLAFSRDQAQRIYVQDRVRAAADDVVRWVDAGAAIYVCGSLEGMAPAVDHALSDILGAERLEQLVAEGRYRRDVY